MTPIRSSSIAIALSLLGLPELLPAAEAPAFAVVPTKARRVDSDIAAVLTEILVGEIVKGSGLRVIGPSDIAAVLGRSAIEQQLGCDDTECLSEIAGQLDTPYIVGGAISRLGDTLTITAQVVSARFSEPIARVQRDTPNDENTLAEAMRAAGRDLVEGWKSAIDIEWQAIESLAEDIESPNLDPAAFGRLAEATRRFASRHPYERRTPRARVLLGKSLLATGDPGRAASAFNAALEDDLSAEDEEAALFGLVESRSTRFNTEGSSEEYRTAIEMYLGKVPNGVHAGEVLVAHAKLMLDAGLPFEAHRLRMSWAATFNDHSEASKKLRGLALRSAFHPVACGFAFDAVQVLRRARSYSDAAQLARELRTAEPPLACSAREYDAMWDLEGQSALDSVYALVDSGNFLEAGRLAFELFQLYSREVGAARVVPLLLSVSAAAFDQGGRLARAMKLRERFLREFEDHPWAAEIEYASALGFERIADFASASVRLSSFARSHRSDERAANAIYYAGLYRSVLGRHWAAADDWAWYSNTFDMPDSSEAALRACRERLAGGDLDYERGRTALLEGKWNEDLLNHGYLISAPGTEEPDEPPTESELRRRVYMPAVTCAERLVDRAPIDDIQCQSTATLALAKLRAGDREGHDEARTELFEQWPVETLKSEANNLAGCRFAVGELLFESASREQSIEQYTSIIELGAAEWGWRALFEIGELHRGGGEIALAVEAYEAIVEAASYHEFPSEWSRRSRERLSELVPERYPPSRERRLRQTSAHWTAPRNGFLVRGADGELEGRDFRLHLGAGAPEATASERRP